MRNQEIEGSARCRPFMKALYVALAMAGALSAGTAVRADEAFPNRPITLIVPFAAGGFNDTSGRIIAAKVAEELGQPVVVENRTGASGVTGTSAVARATPDGYTLGFLSSGPLASNLSLFLKLPYNPVKDFAPITRATITPNVLVVLPSLPVSTLKEFITYLKQRPGQVNYGTTGKGSTPHLSAAVFDYMAGTKMNAVPYRGGSGINNDLLSGQIQVAFSPIVEVLGLIEDGKVRALAVTSTGKSSLLPDLPPVAELLPGYQISIWNGVVAPAGTPRPVVDKLNAAIRKALQDQDVVAKLKKLGLSPAGMSVEEFTAYIPEQIEFFAKLTRNAGIEPE